jgi:hypothetical protein
MEINNSNEQIEQSTVAEPRVLTSFVAYCTSCAPHWRSRCYATKTEAQSLADAHNYANHGGHVGASVTQHVGNC